MKRLYFYSTNSRKMLFSQISATLKPAQQHSKPGGAQPQGEEHTHLSDTGPKGTLTPAQPTPTAGEGGGIASPALPARHPRPPHRPGDRDPAARARHSHGAVAEALDDGERGVVAALLQERVGGAEQSAKRIPTARHGPAGHGTPPHAASGGGAPPAASIGSHFCQSRLSTNKRNDLSLIGSKILSCSKWGPSEASRPPAR